MTFAIWIVGLPGSGKSTIRKELAKKVPFETLEMDVVRKNMPIGVDKYSKEGRNQAYTILASMAADIYNKGTNLVVDATAHQNSWRLIAKEKIPEMKFIFIECPLETCVDRESKREDGRLIAELYKKAIERKETGKQFEGLGPVPGVDNEFEKGNPDLVIDSVKLSAEEAAGKIYELIKNL